MIPLITKNEFPPNIEKIRRHLDLTGEEIFSYGGIIYNPTGKALTDDLINHEMIHAKQQRGQTDEWWKLYLEDPVFRASQEIPAYQVQYQTAKKHIKDRNQLFNYLKQLAMNLSSERYGRVMDFYDAVKAIKEEKLFDVKKLLDFNK